MSRVAVEQRNSLVLPLNDLYGLRLREWAAQSDEHEQSVLIHPPKRSSSRNPPFTRQAPAKPLPQASSPAPAPAPAPAPVTASAIATATTPRPAEVNKAATPSMPPDASLPRSSPSSSAKQRPTSLTLKSTNGCSALPSPKLKQEICNARTGDSTAITQVPVDRREPLPPTPTTPLATIAMGKTHSTMSASPVPDGRSARSVVHVRKTSKPMSRKSSYNLFKPNGTRSPLPRDVTASVMSILYRDGFKKDDSTNEEDAPASVSTDPFCDRPSSYQARYPGAARQPHSTSTVTMTESRAGHPLSASTTIRDFRSITTDDSPDDSCTTNVPDIEELAPRNEERLMASLSPTLPTPSPLPEDSPHKYGLRDNLDTPEIPEVPDAITHPKARRKSSGLEIFTEAKNLQSAASFLNGLSTMRRRAESAAAVQTTESTDSSWTGVTAPSRPGSAQPPSRPVTAFHDGEGRRKGHKFKLSGFAYSRPLTLAQIKCYRNHDRLLLSRNKHAPVECAVCHVDNSEEHFSCSWCALRMCRFCRKDFAERGITALKERIKLAEMGGRVDSVNSSSTESLEALAKVTTSYST